MFVILGNTTLQELTEEWQKKQWEWREGMETGAHYDQSAQELWAFMQRIMRIIEEDSIEVESI